MHKYAMVCADMAGTTVRDDGIVERAAAAALTAAGLEPGGADHTAGMRHVRETMGQSKIEVFRAVLGDEGRAREANATFETTIDDSIAAGDVAPLPHATETLRRLRDAGVKVVLTTGFAPRTQHAILGRLGWTELVDLAVAPGQRLRGRPYPDMILHAVARLGIDDVRRVAVIGDSVNDVYSGLRAGAGLVAGVTTGAHDSNALRQAGATHVLDGIGELPDAVIAAPVVGTTPVSPGRSSR